MRAGRSHGGQAIARLQIFIGSSTEGKAVAEAVAQRLDSAGFEPLRWWTCFAFGQYTLDRLIEISSFANGAVFIFNDDDRVWYRDTHATQPRDNVLLEYGLFVSRVGRERTVFVPSAGTKIPSDLFSITYEGLSRDVETTAARIAQHFKKTFAKSIDYAPENIHLAIDPEWARNHTKSVDRNNWRMYHLYCGRSGSRSWLDASGQVRYWPTDQKKRISDMCVRAAGKSNANTLVSLGSGASELDKHLAIEMRRRNPYVQYIPVDVSESLLHRSVLSNHQEVQVPVGIQADFEDRITFVSREARKHGSSPMLYSCIGNTFGNLDQGEDRFLLNLINSTAAEDMLMLHVTLQGPKWTWELDPRTSSTGFDEAYRRFICNGIVICNREPMERVLPEFERRIEFRERPSDVDGAIQISIFDSDSFLEVLKITRYCWPKLLDYLRERFGAEILFEESKFSSDGVLGDGAVLMKFKRDVSD